MLSELSARKKLLWVLGLALMLMVSVGFTAGQIILHPPSNTTVATSTEPIGAFNLDEMPPTNIVDVAFVQSVIGDPNWVIIDGRDKADYDKGHIPGAVNFGKEIVKTLKHGTDGRVLPPDKAAKLLGEIGVSNDKKVIVYGTKADYHVTIEMLPMYIGVKEFDYLDGGYEAWVAAGKKVDKTPVTPNPATFTPAVKNKNFYVSTEQMAAIVAKKDPNVILLDTRSEKEYSGADVDGLRGGKIPGAIFMPWESVIDKNTGFFFSQQKLAETFKNIPKDKTIVLYCHRGCRTGYVFLALRSMGYKDVRMYEDGFIVWGAQLDKPVDSEHFYNFRGLNSKVRGFEAKDNELEAKNKELEAKLVAAEAKVKAAEDKLKNLEARIKTIEKKLKIKS